MLISRTSDCLNYFLVTQTPFLRFYPTGLRSRICLATSELPFVTEIHNLWVQVNTFLQSSLHGLHTHSLNFPKLKTCEDPSFGNFSYSVCKPCSENQLSVFVIPLFHFKNYTQIRPSFSSKLLTQYPEGQHTNSKDKRNVSEVLG
jgi:hypothetical protein